MKRLVLLFTALLPILACHKENPDYEPVTPPVYVQIYQPGDTSLGVGYAKKLTADWAAQAICTIHAGYDTNFIAIAFQTYNNQHQLKENLNFFYIPRSGAEQTFGLKKMSGDALKPGFVSATYTTWKFDGDLPEDNYRLDTTATDNFFKLEKIDLVNKRVEGSFSAAFNIVLPRKSTANPYFVKFTNGKFRGVLQ